MDRSLAALFADFEAARRSAKPSPHSERAARSDFAAIHALLRPAGGADAPTPADINPRRLRLALARFAETHAAASIARCWSTWNRFYRFLVAEDVVAANPMGAVPHPKVGRPAPKPLPGATADEIQVLLDHQSPHMSQGYIDARPNRTDRAGPGRRTDRVLERLTGTGAPATRPVRTRPATPHDTLPGIATSSGPASGGAR